MSTFSQEELLILEGLKIAPEEVTKLIELHGEQSFVTAVAGVLNIRQGGGMERNESFTPQAAVEGHTETNGVISASVEEFNAMSEEEKAKFKV